jgi:hypothetical protein
MCVTTQDCKPVANYLHKIGKDVYDIFPDLVQRIDPRSVKQGHCLVTGEPMSHNHMYPNGLTPRHMTDAAYNQIINRGNKYQCAMCETYLTDGKLQMQQKQPREMKHHHCDRCWDYHLLLAGAVHGVPEALRVVNTRHLPADLRTLLGGVLNQGETPALPYEPAEPAHEPEVPQITYAPQKPLRELIGGDLEAPSRVKQLIRRIKS